MLLTGLPGTGKTLLARAVAGEAGAPFLSLSASEFIEMVVRGRASRVRDLFEQAKQAAPAIIFIDELDVVGRARGAGPMMGGHDEREQTLNQIPSEIDGFSGSEGVVVFSARNRPEILGAALLRPGRFDRRIEVSPPDWDGRGAILEAHTPQRSARRRRRPQPDRRPNTRHCRCGSAKPGQRGGADGRSPHARVRRAGRFHRCPGASRFWAPSGGS